MKIGEYYISKAGDHIIELLGFGPYGPDQMMYFRIITGDAVGYIIHFDAMWDSYSLLKDGPDKIENMKEGDFYVNKETGDVIMVQELNSEKLVAKFKFVLANETRHKMGDEIWFDLRIVDSRYEKLEGDENEKKES